MGRPCRWNTEEHRLIRSAPSRYDHRNGPPRFVPAVINPSPAFPAMSSDSLRGLVKGHGVDGVQFKLDLIMTGNGVRRGPRLTNNLQALIREMAAETPRA